jgi:hypothetical protein
LPPKSPGPLYRGNIYSYLFESIHFIGNTTDSVQENYRLLSIGSHQQRPHLIKAFTFNSNSTNNYEEKQKDHMQKPIIESVNSMLQQNCNGKLDIIKGQ